jgi:hypothetical protein
MPRIRSQSQSFNLYVSTGAATGQMSGTGDIRQLFRLTSIGGPEWTYEKAPISVIGKLAPITRDTNDSPTVSVPFSYYVTDFQNEVNLGFNVSTGTTVGNGAISDILTKTTLKDEKNYFILVTGVNGATVANWLATPAIDPANGLQITAANSNFKLPAGSIGASTKPFVLKPGDITVDLSSAAGLFADTTTSSFNIQSFNISFDLARDPIQSIGSRYAKSRELTFPIDVNFTVEAIAGDLKTGNLREFVCNTGVYQATVAMKRPDCANNGSEMARVTLKGLNLQSEAFSVDVDDNQTVSLTWLGSIGSPTDADNNIFFNGQTSY